MTVLRLQSFRDTEAHSTSPSSLVGTQGCEHSRTVGANHPPAFTPYSKSVLQPKWNGHHFQILLDTCLFLGCSSCSPPSVPCLHLMTYPLWCPTQSPEVFRDTLRQWCAGAGLYMPLPNSSCSSFMLAAWNEPCREYLQHRDGQTL